MSSEQDFVIENGVLKKYTGQERDITIPSGVATIGEGAFREAKTVERIMVPDGVTTVEEHAFADCKNLKEVTLAKTVTKIGSELFWESYKMEKLTVLSEVPKISRQTVTLFYIEDRVPEVVAPNLTLLTSGTHTKYIGDSMVIKTSEEYAYVWLFQTRRDWSERLAAFQPELDVVMKTFASILESNPKVPKAVATGIADFLSTYDTAVDTESAKKLLDTMAEKKVKMEGLAKEFPRIGKFLGDGAPVAENGADDLIRSACDGYSFHPDAIKAVKAGLPFADGSGKAPKEALMYLLSVYMEQWDKHMEQEVSYGFNGEEFLGAAMLKDGAKVEISKTADNVAALLDQSALTEFLEGKAFGNTYRKFLLSYARFASGESIARCVSEIGKRRRGNAKDRYWAENATEALMISETPQAALFLGREGKLEEYAAMRGLNSNDLRKTALAEYSLDEKGEKTFDLGGNVVTVSLEPDLSLRIFDGNGKKAVKTLPKKGADPEKLERAADVLAVLKKDVKGLLKVYKNRLLAAYLSGDALPVDQWRETYTQNAVQCRLAQLLVWSQGKATFTLNAQGKAVDSAGKEVAIAPDKDIAAAHPMEMKPAEVETWQKYFTSRGLKQPFEQVWEPVREGKAVKQDRYEGVILPANLFRSRERHGITFEFDYNESSLFIGFQDCHLWTELTELQRHSIDPNATVKLGAFEFKKYTRQVNHIVALLDKWTVAQRIESDDASAVTEMLPGFTLAQITELIDLAAEKKAANCTAALLEYKNAHFQGNDPMDAFTLE